MDLANGDVVRVVRCGQCDKLVGKMATVKSIREDGMCQLSFGRGRPNKNRPEFFNITDLETISVVQQ